ncbi:RimJ/RimL family protein N-acetyltransferase [Branchiibius hedensis]|uniref:Protein N-acetyltransferase, RimJ/RimL family n=1 Tax=Branchiibius hedensis TaxID=672460 RepID=A0A2Y8ZZB1_9MICO|nr:GNAT family protein [Branchiibius hedensis]PWJ26778.1 RimJ/RimL family protein N-acetyltransferase [Branchiibius hedensis]SSA35589.1 Protein N-acetyltransferase, RimJ/RimL family [Branchiibius hedensis]
MASTFPSDGPLVGRVVRLERLSEADIDELHQLMADPRAFTSGAYPFETAHTTREQTASFVESRLADSASVPYAVRLLDGTLAGTSSLLEIDLANEKTHIGSTFYGRDFWGTQVNPDAKLLLLGHAFDECGFGRVKIQTDHRNERSRAAIARLGATYEGTLRRDVRRLDGSWRDTVVFSVLADEWPDVRERLRRRLD